MLKMIIGPSLSARKALLALSPDELKRKIHDVVWRTSEKLNGLAYLIGTSDAGGDSKTAICWILEDIAEEIRMIYALSSPTLKEDDEP